MRKSLLGLSRTTTAIAVALAALFAAPYADAGPGIAPVWSAAATPPPAGGPDTFANTYYANSPMGLRPDPVANSYPGGWSNPTSFINTGTAMRKFVDILPSIQGLAPTTNAGTGVTGSGAKYIPLATPGTWPTDGADYYHIAVVEYTEQMHSDLPRATTLRGYVQIEEPGLSTIAPGSKHVALSYPNGSPMLLPDATGTQQQVYAYDNPHYMGPVILATKDKAVRIKYSNLLPIGGAADSFGNGVAGRNGDLFVPVDPTLPGGAYAENRVDVHLHGGLTPWISDGTPHQWTIPVGDPRYGFLSDIAVTAVGSGYTAPVVTIDPPQSIATATAVISGGGVSALTLTNPGALYNATTSPAIVTIAPPTPPGTTAAGYSATATSNLNTSGGVLSLTVGNAGSGYTTAPVVTIGGPPPSTTATASATVAAGAVGTLTVPTGAGGSGYTTAPLVTIGAPQQALPATGAASVNSATGALSAIGVNAGNFGYWGVPSAPTVTVAAPPAAVSAAGAATVSVSNGALTAIGINANNFGYWSAPKVKVAPPPFTALAAATVSSVSLLGVPAANAVVGMPGFGYWSAPSLTVDAPPVIVPATGTATMNGATGGVATIAVGANFGYWSTPAVAITPPAAPVAAAGTASYVAASHSVGTVTVNANNFGYWSANNPGVTLASPQAAVAAVAAPTVSATNGAISAVAINANFGYWAAPGVSIAAPPSAVSAAGSASSVSATGVPATNTTISNVGYGYWTAPNVAVAAPPARVRAAGAASSVSAAGIPSPTTTISNVGFGYWTAPTVTVAAPPARVNATATVTLAAGVPAATVNAANYGYWATPTVTITGGTALAGTTLVVPTPSVSIANGRITAIVLSGGANYATAPRVNIAGATAGTTATAAATVADGVVTGVTITGGTGYNPAAAAPALTFANGTNGTRATATATVADGVVTGVTIAGGTGYNPALPPVLTFGAPSAGTAATVRTVTINAAGVVTGITLGNAGRGYNPLAPPIFTIGAPTASVTATASPVLSNGTITAINVSGGANYLTAPSVTISAPAASVQAVVTASAIANGRITGVTVSGGTNYPAAPQIVFSAPTAGTVASASATVANGTVNAITLSGGTGYDPLVAPPAITFITPPTAGTQAVASATVANGRITGIAFTGTGGTAGSGYNPAALPTITIDAATTGTQAVASATLSGGSITGIVFTGTGGTAGSGYDPTAAPPAITISAPAPSVQASATAVVTAGSITGFTNIVGGTNYLNAPAVNLAAPPPGVTATATATVDFTGQLTGTAGAVSGFLVTNAGSGYGTTPPPVSLTQAPFPTNAAAIANIAPDGSIGGFTITNAGSGYKSAPVVTISAPAGAVQAVGVATFAGGALTGVSVDPTSSICAGAVPACSFGAGYLSTPNVTVTDKGAGSGGAINALVQMPVGASFHQVPDMVGAGTVCLSGCTSTSTATSVNAGYTPPAIGEGTLYYTNNQTERLMFYHDHASAITRLNVYAGMAAGYLINDPAVDPALPIPNTTVPTATSPTSLAGFVPEEQIPLVIQDRTFVPQDIAQQDQNWDQGHWGKPGDLWFPHVYETNQNPAFLHSLSNLGRWDWGPWFAIVYPAMYALPSGVYGDVTTTPEAYQDTPIVNGTAYPTLTVEPRAYRLRILNAANDRFLNLGFYLADTTQAAGFADALHAAGTNYTEVQQVANQGPQPSANPTPNIFNSSFVSAANGFAVAPTPWPTDGRIAPPPTAMGPPMISIGNEAGLLPQWVQHDPVPVNFDYNRRSATVLNVSQNNDYTQLCAPECHGLYLGPAERADVIVDFAPYAGQTLILYNDAPAPNPGYDTRIDYYTGDDPTNLVNYITGGAPNTQPGYGPNTRTIMQVIVGTVQNVSGLNPIDYTSATTPDAKSGMLFYNPSALGAGRVLSKLTSALPGVIQNTYAHTQAPPIVGESAYNIAFNPSTFGYQPAATATNGGYTDQYGNMYLASQNQPEFYLTNPGPLTITAINVTGNTSATAAASGVGLGNGSSGTNAGAGSGTGYTTPPAVVISPPSCFGATTTGQTSGCQVATATAQIAGGQVTGVTLTNPGAGYNEVPSVTFVAGGSVTSVALTNGGSGYTPGSTLPVAIAAPPPINCIVSAATPVCPSSPVQATATANVNASGVIASITINTAGSGYSSSPAVVIPAPGVVAATASAVLGTGTLAGTVGGVTMIGNGSGYAAAPAVTFSAPPSGTPAVIAPTLITVAGTTYLTGLSIKSAGAGYATAPVISLASSCGAGGTTTLDASGAVATVTLTGIGLSGTCLPTDTVVLSTSPVPGVLAAGTAVMDAATGTTVINVNITTAGSGYVTAPTVTFAGGVQATATAAASGGGYGATAIAITSNTQVFVVPGAIPGNAVPPTPNAAPITLPPGLSALLGCNGTSCSNLSGAVIGNLMNPAIQELFEPFYGRMNATLGIEMPNQSLQVQTTLPLNYVDPATEFWQFNKPVMWKITHNGVDAHPVHFHLLNLQLVNRVGWDGTIKAPEDDEIGWKETIKMNPLEDIIVVMRPTQPQVPFGLDRSIRAEDPSQPLGVNMGFTQYTTNGITGAVGNQSPSETNGRGQTAPSAGYIFPASYYAGGVLLGVGDPATIVNSLENYDNEYVWHCHILGHEENDFMRPISVISAPVVPPAPGAVAATQSGTGSPIVLTWTDPTPVAAQSANNGTFGNPANELGFLVQRSIDGQNWTTVAKAPANATTATDPLLNPVTSGAVYYYQVLGYNAAGSGSPGVLSSANGMPNASITAQ